ncbi:putative uncharacterized protein DDB_G0290521, partial [Xiphias gladius]|uniref:putative uncharacterized protein DDB_G0290521 n=1 Tax=Xiphias gladius TaxID=8245 RepID=UPI001A9A051A
SGTGAEEGSQTEPEVSPQKKVIKPPMPPTKEAKPSSAPEDEPDKDDGPEKEVLKPPMPPSKEAKTCISLVEEVTEEAKAERMSEKSPDVVKKTGPPPTPPNKPSSSSSMSNSAEISHFRPNPLPPTPQSKENKPSYPALDPDQEVQGTADENKEKEEDSRRETTGKAVETDEADHSISKQALPNVRGDNSPSTEVQVSKEELGDIISSPSPLQTSKKKPEKLVQPDTQQIEANPTTIQLNERQDRTASLQTSSDTSDSSLQAEEALPKSEVPSVVVSSNDPLTDSPSLSPQLCHLPGEEKKKAEEKSVDSGQHSENDSEGSGSEDTLVASTAVLRGSHASLDVLDATEDNIQISVILRPTQAATEPQDISKVLPCLHSKSTTPLKSSTKARSASIGDLLSDSSVCIQLRQHTRAVAGSDMSPTDDIMKLETEVALEMEKTTELLSRVSQSQVGGKREGTPEDLLAKAMEKLEKADHVLREVKKLKLAKNSSYRKSW